MARFTLQMTCDTAAFEHDMHAEIATTLREIATKLKDGLGPYETNLYHTIHDFNGNDIGRWRLAINRQD